MENYHLMLKIMLKNIFLSINKMSKCVFCQAIFLDKYKLERHQKTTKFCLELQDKYKCDICKSKYSSEKDLKTHKCKMDNEVIVELILELKNKVKILEEKVDYSQFIQNSINPLTKEYIENALEKLTFEDLELENFGLAEFVYKNLFKDKIKCLDYSRKKFVYKDEREDVVEDYNLIKFTPLFFSVIKDKAFSLIDEARILREKKIKECDDINEEDIEAYTELKDLKYKIEDAISGVRTKWVKTFVGTLAGLSK
jgi:hypothetical protein